MSEALRHLGSDGFLVDVDGASRSNGKRHLGLTRVYALCRGESTVYGALDSSGFKSSWLLGC